jgi:hypothetical protein
MRLAKQACTGVGYLELDERVMDEIIFADSAVIAMFLIETWVISSLFRATW